MSPICLFGPDSDGDHVSDACEVAWVGDVSPPSGTVVVGGQDYTFDASIAGCECDVDADCAPLEDV